MFAAASQNIHWPSGPFPLQSRDNRLVYLTQVFSPIFQKSVGQFDNVGGFDMICNTTGHNDLFSRTRRIGGSFTPLPSGFSIMTNFGERNLVLDGDLKSEGESCKKRFEKRVGT